MTTVVPLQNATADFSQPLYRPFVVGETIDGNLGVYNGWGVQEELGQSHVAVYETRNNIGYPEGSILTFTNVQTDKAGKYSVTVSNLVGSVTSAEAALNVNPAPVPPTIVAQPQNQTVTEGESVTFKVTALGTFLSYQWQFNGANIDGAIGPSLSFADVGFVNAGRYSVIVSNEFGSVVSAEAVLTVKPSPVVLLQNATADYSQPLYRPFVVGETIDGKLGVYNGWGVQGELGQSHVAVYETRNNIGFPEGSILSFTLYQNYPEHTIGRFRLSVTTDDRNTFADGKSTGGAVEANWVVLEPYSFESREHATMTRLGDNSILVSGIAPNTDLYTIKANTSLTHITGLRLEVIADLSLPHGGPGRCSENGNFVVTELQVGIEPGHLQPIAPAIVRQPQNQAVVAGGTASFSVAVQGTTLSYQWLFNGTEISGATGGTLTLTDVQAANAGKYSVVVANALGSVTSAEAVLTVNPAPVPPTITAQPQSQTVLAGSSVSFAVSASGSLPLTYQWQLNGKPLAGAINRVLTLNNVQAANAGTYRVLVANAAGSVLSDGASLVLQAGPQPPTIIAQSGSVVASPGGNASFWVSVAGAEPFSYQWYFNGKAITGASARELSLTNQQASQAGTYTVAITNPYGAVSSSGLLLNIADASGGGTVDFMNMSLDMGIVYDVDGVTRLAGSAYLVQLYGGTSPENLQPIGPPASFLSSGHFAGGTRVVVTVAPGQAGWFQVKAWEAAYGCSYEEARAGGGKNGASEPFQSQTSDPRVVPPVPPARLTGMRSFALLPGGPVTLPEITTQPQSQAVLLGADASLSVEATGTAPLRYQWYFNGVVLSGANGTGLSFTNAQAANSGEYRVVVSNPGGAVTSQVAILTVKVERFLFVNCPAEAQPEGSQISLPLVLNSQGEVAGLTFRLSYNADYLAMPEITWDSALEGALKQVNVPVPGQLQGVFAFGSGAVPAGPQALGVVSFRIRTVTGAASSDLGLEILDVAGPSGDPIINGTQAQGGSVRVVSTGSLDNNANGRWDVGDANLLLRLITRLETIRPWDTSRNDLNVNGVLDSGDVVKLLRAVAATPEPGLAEGQVNPAAVMAERVVLSPARQRGEAGLFVTVQVRLEGLVKPVSAADWVVNYPVGAVRLSAKQFPRVGTLMPAGAVMTYTDDGAGKLRLSLGSAGPASDGTAAVSPNGVLAELTFEVLAGATSQYAWPLTVSSVEAWSDGYSRRLLAGSSAVLVGRNPVAGQVSGVIHQDGAFRFSLKGDAGADYVVETSEDLVNWTTWKTVTDGTSAADVSDLNVAQHLKRFYRVRPVE
jgi:hypothetical protein